MGIPETWTRVIVRPDISVIIPSWNTRTHLKECLRSLLADSDTCSIPIEIIVVDNASGDDSAAMVASEFPAVHLLQNPGNLGFARACNRGMEIARGRYLLLLNSDTLVTPHALCQMARFADSHPEAGIVGCRVLKPDGCLQPSCLQFPSVINLLLWSTHLPAVFPGSRVFGRALYSWWAHDSERDVDAVQGSCLLARREAVQTVGLLDTSYFMYCEETDWCWQMRRAGWKVKFSACAEIVHFGGASTAQMPVEMTLQLLGSHLLFLRKNRGRIHYVSGCAVVALLCAMRALYLPLLGVVGAVGRQRAWMISLGFLKGVRGVVMNGAEGLLYKPRSTVSC